MNSDSNYNQIEKPLRIDRSLLHQKPPVVSFSRTATDATNQSTPKTSTQPLPPL